MGIERASANSTCNIHSQIRVQSAPQFFVCYYGRTLHVSLEMVNLRHLYITMLSHCLNVGEILIQRASAYST